MLRQLSQESLEVLVSTEYSPHILSYIILFQLYSYFCDSLSPFIAGRTRYAISTGASGTGWAWPIGSRATSSSYGSSSNQVRPPYLPGRFKGRQLLDHEALTCLLILLFVDEPKLNIGRLHRVLKNLCHHIPTRIWVINSLLAIMEKTREAKDLGEHHRTRKSSNAGSGSHRYV